MGSEPAGRRRFPAVVGAAAARGRQPGHGPQHLRALSAAGHPRRAARDPGADARAPPARRPDGDGSRWVATWPSTWPTPGSSSSPERTTCPSPATSSPCCRGDRGVPHRHDRRLPAVDRVLATVLFSDIAASTTQAVAMGDARWRELLDDTTTWSPVRWQRSPAKQIKTTGDGVLATFEGPAQATAQRHGDPGRAARLGSRVRARAHTGEVERRGDDVGGIAVHIAARVAGPSGEVGKRGGLAGGHRPRRRTPASASPTRGEHALKGVAGEWALFAVEG